MRVRVCLCSVVRALCVTRDLTFFLFIKGILSFAALLLLIVVVPLVTGCILYWLSQQQDEDTETDIMRRNISFGL